MKKILLLSVFLCQFTFAESSSGFLFLGEVEGKPSSLFYNDKNDEYSYKVRGKTYRYPRRAYKRMLDRHIFDLPSEDHDKLKKIVKNHANTQKLSKATDEEVLEAGLEMLKISNNIVSPQRDPCERYTEAPGDNTFKFSESDEQKKRNDDIIISTALADEGFLKMGDVTGTKLELMTCNDNPLHGGLSSTGITTHAKGIEGDDRGKTFCIKGGVTLEFEKGEISIRKFSDGYSKLSNVPGDLYYFRGQAYQSYRNYDKDGKRYQEFLNIDGVEIELKKQLGEDDIYVKLIARHKTMSDSSGLAKSIQQGWHESLGKVEYSYIDHMKDKKGFEGYIELGKEFDVYSTTNTRVTATTSASVQGSQLGETESFVQVAGEVKAVFLDNVGENGKRFPDWEARVYIKQKKYLDSEDGTIKGVELTKRFAVNENNFIYIKAGVGQDEDRWAKYYGVEEMNRNGRLDYNHTLGLGYEFKFK